MRVYGRLPTRRRRGSCSGVGRTCARTAEVEPRHVEFDMEELWMCDLIKEETQ